MAEPGGIDSAALAAQIVAQVKENAPNANTEGVQPEPNVAESGSPSDPGGVYDLAHSAETGPDSDTGTDTQPDIVQAEPATQEQLTTDGVPGLAVGEVQEPVSGDELYYQLLEVGIDLGAPPSEIPPEQLGAYNKLANRAFDLVAQSTQESRQAQQMVIEMQEFAQQLNNDPKRLAMMIALNSPDAFAEVRETVERMQEDPRERDLVIRELEADVRFSATQRAELAAQRVTAMQKATRVRRVTQSAAAELGIPVEAAEKLIAAEIQNRGGHFDIKDVGPTLNALLGTRATARAAPAPAAPARQAAVQQADTQAVAGVSTPAQPTVTSVEPGMPKRVSLSPREAVRQAFRNTMHLGKS